MNGNSSTANLDVNKNLTREQRAMQTFNEELNRVHGNGA
jgi:hypothetical protein